MPVVNSGRGGARGRMRPHSLHIEGPVGPGEPLATARAVPAARTRGGQVGVPGAPAKTLRRCPAARHCRSRALATCPNIPPNPLNPQPPAPRDASAPLVALPLASTVRRCLIVTDGPRDQPLGPIFAPTTARLLQGGRASTGQAALQDSFFGFGCIARDFDRRCVPM